MRSSSSTFWKTTRPLTRSSTTVSPSFGPAEPHGVRTIARLRGQIAAGAVVDGLPSRRERGGALRLELVGRAVARVRASFAEQALGLGDVRGRALALEERPLVPRDLRATRGSR